MAVPRPDEARETRLSDPMVTPELRLFSFVGTSGKASVWLAEHLGLEVPVVVRLLPRESAKKPEILERFRREAVVVVRLRTPHVVQVLDYGTTPSGCAFIALELVEGETVEAALRRRGSLTLAEAVEVVRQTGRVLAKARDLRIRCNDIQPHKVFLLDGEEGPFVKLTDFATDADSTSPEADATNVGALGNLAWRCLAGSPALPSPIEDWLARAGAPLGDKSFRSVRDLLDALEAALEAVRRGDYEVPVESGEIPLVRRTRRVRGPSTEEVDDAWPTEPPSSS